MGVRNFKNINRTYPHLGYKTILKDTLANTSRKKMPKSYSIRVHPNDEIMIWIKGKNDHDSKAQVIKTTLAAWIDTKNEFRLNNEGNIKNLVIKLVK